MRSLMTVLTAAVLLWTPGQISAAEGEAVLIVERIQDLRLSDEQEAQIAEIQKEYRPRVQEAAKELAGVVKEEMEKVQGVLTAEQKEKIQAAREKGREGRTERQAQRLCERIAHLQQLDLTDAEREKIQEIRKEYRPKIEKALESLKGTLTAEQQKAREEGLKAGKKRREVIASLKLTDAQKEKVEAAGKELRALVHEEMGKIRDLLTDTQKEKLQAFKGERREHVRDRGAHRIANLKDLNLTDAQKGKIAEIREEYRPKIQEAGNKLRSVIREEVHKIVGVLKA